MKVEEVPQDKKYLDGTVLRDLVYAVDDDGNYQTVVSVGWTPKNEALEVTMADIKEDCGRIARRVRDGQASPLEYYMVRNIMSVKLLSKYTGIPKRKIKKHMTPEGFAGLDRETMEKYAEALRISVEELKSISSEPWS